MRRLILLLLVIACLSIVGCQMPGDVSPFGGPGGTYNSNTAAEAKKAGW